MPAIGFMTALFAWEWRTIQYLSAPYLFDGTGKWYVSYSASKCVKDCPGGGAAQCGGVVTESHLTLYDEASACCSEKLWWVGDCAASSLAG